MHLYDVPFYFLVSTISYSSVMWTLGQHIFIQIGVLSLGHKDDGSLVAVGCIYFKIKFPAVNCSSSF